MPRDYTTVLAYLERQIDAIDARDTESAKWRTSSTCPVKYFEDKPTRYRAYFLESCHTTLAHTEPLIAFRACVQVFQYAHAAVGHEKSDLLIDCRNRIEDLLLESAQRQRELKEAALMGCNPSSLEDDYALSRRVCHAQALEIDALKAQLAQR